MSTKRMRTERDLERANLETAFMISHHWTDAQFIQLCEVMMGWISQDWRDQGEDS